MNNSIRAFFTRTIALHPIIIKATGSIKLAALWDQIHYWSDKTNDPDGWVYKSQEEISDETGIKRKGIETARKLGEKLGVLSCKVCGVPPTTHYRVNEDAMIELIESYLKKHPLKQQRKIKKEKVKVVAVKEELLPDWVDIKAWAEWEQHRKEKKCKLTPLARKKQLAFLSENKEKHVEIIQNSIRNGWQGLFAIKDQAKKGTWKCQYGHEHTIGQQCGHGLQRSYDNNASEFAKKISGNFKMKK